MLTLPDTLHWKGGLGRGLRLPPAAECDGLCAVTGQGTGPLMAPSGLELGATGLFGSPGLMEKPGAGVPVVGPTWGPCIWLPALRRQQLTPKESRPQPAHITVYEQKGLCRCSEPPRFRVTRYQGQAPQSK